MCLAVGHFDAMILMILGGRMRNSLAAVTMNAAGQKARSKQHSWQPIMQL
jgi:hypothetical protein